MFCPKCGKEINDDSVFCKHCGNRVESDIKEETTPVNTSKDIPKSETGQEPQVINCSNCGKLILRTSVSCPHCEVLLDNTKQTINNKDDSFRCPKCGSDRISRNELFKQRLIRSGKFSTTEIPDQKTNKQLSGIGCLLWIIIFLLCPLLIIIPMLMIGYSFVQIFNDWGMIIFMITIFISYFYVLVYNKNLYICERCGHKFRIKNNMKFRFH